MSVFNVDFDKLNLQLLPTMLRTPLMAAMLQAKTEPVAKMWLKWLSLRNDIHFLLKYNTSKRNVEIVLRKKFGIEGIYIENATGDYTENESDESATYLEEFLDFYLGEQSQVVDFIIFVPATDLTEMLRADIHNFASLFVLPGFKYRVKTF